MAMVKLMGIRIAIAGLITLIIVHIELPALSWSALFILAMIALEGVLPQSWFRKLVMFFKRAALLGVVLLVLPFMLMHMRDAIHPQLKGFSYGYTDSISSYSGRGSSHNRKNNYVAEQAMEMDGMAMPPPPPMIVPGVKTAGKIANRAIQKSQRFQGFYQYDPGAIVQTGFGVANWRGDTIALSWNGPVNHNQDVGLWLMSPSINLVLAFIRVLLLLMFVGFLLQVKFASFSSLLAKLRAKNTVALLLLGVLFIGLPQQSLAENGDIPPVQLLKELKHYALKERDKAPECLPQCATIARAHIQANGGRLSLRMEVHMSETAAIPLPGMKDHWPIEAVLVDGKAASGLLSQGKYTWLELAEGKHDVLVTGRLPDRDSLSINFKLKPHYVDFDVKGWELYGVHEDGIAEGNIQLVRIKAKQEKEATDDLEQTAIPPFVKVERTLSLGTSWTMVTRIHRQVPSDFAFVLTIPLINGESVTTPGVRVKNKAVEVNMAPHTSSFVWESVLKKSPRITLKADTNSAWVESWKLQATNLWHVEMAGIPKIHTGQAFPEWRPWPGEKVVLNITKPEGVAGQTKTIDKVKLKVNVGQRALDASAEFNIRSSRGDQHSVTLPEGAVLQSLVLNQRAQPLQQNGRQVTFPLSPGNQTITLSWKQPEGISSHFTMPELNLGIPSVNVETILTLPRDRWVLFTGGGLVGPAVLFWGVFPVLVLLSVALGFVNITPLKSYHWLLLLIGLSQTNIAVNVVVIGWFLAMGWRHKSAMSNSYGWFDTRQVVLGLWTVAAVISIFVAIQQGLLGSPNMKITGNGSHTYYLKWYQDISDVILPRPWAFSVPVLLYRGLMLLWALWLAFAFTGWLKWSWACFSEGDLWRKRPNKVKKEEPADKKAQESEGE